MKMMTAAIASALPKLYATDGVKAEDKTVVAKYFQPWGRWTWYVVEGQEEETEEYGKTWLFFGYVEGIEGEWGYFTLAELESVRGPMGLRIERDIHWTPTKFSEITTR